MYARCEAVKRCLPPITATILTIRAKLSSKALLPVREMVARRIQPFWLSEPRLSPALSLMHKQMVALRAPRRSGLRSA